MENHDFPGSEIANQMLPNVDQQLLQSTLNTQLQFNPDYYRIYTPQEIIENEEMKQTPIHTGVNLLSSRRNT